MLQEINSPQFFEQPAEWNDLDTEGYVEIWHPNLYQDHKTGFSDLAQPGIAPWSKFLYFSTFVACVIAAILMNAATRMIFNLEYSSTMFESQSSLSQEVAVNTSDESGVQENLQPIQVINSECLVSEKFPSAVHQWCELITVQANRRDLPANLVAAVILQESGGNPQAYSHSGAVGLMQVMPRDGLAASFRCINGPCFADRPSMKELYDPEFNVTYGAKMLARLVAKHGNFRDALKSYGPMDAGYSYADKVLRIYERYNN